jgi:hypothetical protein
MGDDQRPGGSGICGWERGLHIFVARAQADVIFVSARPVEQQLEEALGSRTLYCFNQQEG